MRSWVVLGLLFAALAVGVSPAAAVGRDLERGIVQSVAAERLVLRSLDGSDVGVALAGTTRVRLNGRAASPAELRPGQVVEVVAVRGTARIVRAFGVPSPAADVGVIASVSRTSVALSQQSGATVTIAVTPRTLVRVGIVPVARRLLRAGLEVRVIRAADGSAKAIVIRNG